jgi:diacylglycerol kinase family enzyme
MVQIFATRGSGNGRALGLARRLQAALEARGWRTRLDDFADVRRLARWRRPRGARISHIVCVGGDGTMSAAARAAIRHQIPFVPVPSGFGNLFARAFGHRGRVETVVELLDHGQIIRADAAAANGEIFLCHSSYGMLAQIQAAVEAVDAQPRSRLRRLLAYVWTARRFLVDPPRSAIRVEVDGRIVSRRASLVTVANVEAYGGFLSLTPSASPTDGLLDVFVLPRTTRRALWGGLLRRLLRLPIAAADALLVRGRRVSVEAGAVRDEIEVLPRALRLLVASPSSSHPSSRAA